MARGFLQYRDIFDTTCLSKSCSRQFRTVEIGRHSLLDAIHFLPMSLWQLGCTYRWASGSSRVASPCGRFLSQAFTPLSSYLFRISNRQSLGASLVDVCRRSHQAVMNEANANRGLLLGFCFAISMKSMLLLLRSSLPDLSDAVGGPRTGDSIVEPIASRADDISAQPPSSQFSS